MAELVTFKMTGLAQLERDLNELTADLRKKVVRQGLRDAAKPILKAARANAKPRDFSSNKRVAGTLRRAINIFNSKRYKLANGQIGVYITVKASKATRTKRPVSGDPFYWRFVEGGHRIVPRKGRLERDVGITLRRRRATGLVKPYPFLGPAFRSQGEQARRIFIEAINARIEKANAKR